jgi:hypothetical protein
VNEERAFGLVPQEQSLPPSHGATVGSCAAHAWAADGRAERVSTAACCRCGDDAPVAGCPRCQLCSGVASVAGVRQMKGRFLNWPCAGGK